MLALRIGTWRCGHTDADRTEPSRHGIRVEQVGRGWEALELLRLYVYDIILIDTRLPDMPGHKLLRAIRAMGLLTPTVMLTDAASAKATVQLLDLGADDVVAIPRDIDELIARLRSIVRRSQGHANSTLRMDPVELCLARREVRIHGNPVRLSGREYALFELLFLKHDALVSRCAILHHLHGATGDVESKAIDVLVCRLRKKLTAAGAPNLIVTGLGGYTLRDPERTRPPTPPAVPARADRGSPDLT